MISNDSRRVFWGIKISSFSFSPACSFDFEDGIGGWEMTGTAFIHQPTFGDNPAARRRESAQQQGEWWIGGMEYRPSESDPAGWQNPAGGDLPQGTLTSPCFRIVGRDISFLIGGGCTISDIRAELIVKNPVRLSLWPLCFLWFFWNNLGRFINVSDIWSFKIAKLFWGSWYPWDSFIFTISYLQGKNIFKKRAKCFLLLVIIRVNDSEPKNDL